MAAASNVPQYARWLDPDRLRTLSTELGDPDPVVAARHRAFEAFEQLPVEPNPIYRGYANIGGADLSALAPSGRGAPVPLPPSDPATLRVVHDASGTRTELPRALAEAGVRVRTLPEIWKGADEAPGWVISPAVADDKLTAFARAMTNRAVEIDVPDRCPLPVRVQELTILSQPDEILSIRRRLRVGPGSRLLVSEEVYSTGHGASARQRLHGSSTDLALGEGATARYLTVHAPDPSAVSLYQRYATLGARARLGWVWTGFGGLRIRAKMLTELAGNGSDAEDLQTFYGRGSQAYDSQVQITHLGTDTHGQSITRGLFADSSQGVSRGLARIEKEARKTLSYLSEHAMLLSRGARSDTIPILEILCRDVKATHSSSVAPVDPEKVFYLESRGIARPEAVRMIGEGFLSHVLERAPIAQLRDHLYPLLAARWDDREIRWETGRFPALPPLSVTDEVAPEEWRFDAKLR